MTCSKRRISDTRSATDSCRRRRGKTTVLINRIINILKFGEGRDSKLAPDWATEDDLMFLTEYLTDPKPENCAQAERLCAVNPARPWQVIAITFTNKAARELRERLERALDDAEAASQVWAYTFPYCMSENSAQAYGTAGL